MDQGTTSGEIGVTKLPPSNPIPRGKNSTRKIPNFKLWETPTDGIIGKREPYIRVSIRGL